MDETGITNVHKLGKIVASKGKQQVWKITSGKHGAMNTVVRAMCANSTYIPPLFIFFRKRMVDGLATGTPPGSIARVSANGWTDSSLFLE